MRRSPGAALRRGPSRGERSRRSPSGGAPPSRREGRRRRGSARAEWWRRDSGFCGLLSSSYRLQGEKGRDQIGGLLPLTGLARELLSAGGRERIELRAAVVVGLSPFRLHEAVLLELQRGGVQRSVV